VTTPEFERQSIEMTTGELRVLAAHAFALCDRIDLAGLSIDTLSTCGARSRMEAQAS